MSSIWLEQKVKELEIELRSLKARVDTLERENERLKTREKDPKTLRLTGSR